MSKCKSLLSWTISPSQLSRKQSDPSPKIFEKVFKHLVLEVQAKTKNKSLLRDIGRLMVIDSTTMSMSLGEHPWATFRKTKAGIKFHLRIVMTKDLTVPYKAAILPVFIPETGQDMKRAEKYNWKAEFQFIVNHFDEREVEHLNDSTYDPLF